MDIYLSVNNRSDILQIPVLPAEYTISKPQGLQTFETVSKGDLQLIGAPKLKGITITSFFPVRDYPYLRNTEMRGWDYVNKIDDWIEQKLPIRLIITGTPINMVVAVKNFEYTIKTDGDLWYTLELEQFNLLGYEFPQNADSKESELTMTQYEELKANDEYQQSLIDELRKPSAYNEDNIPSWAGEAVQAAKGIGILEGDDNGLNLSYSDLKTLVWLYRLNLLN